MLAAAPPCAHLEHGASLPFDSAPPALLPRKEAARKTAKAPTPFGAAPSPAADGGAKLGARRRAQRHDESGFVRDLAGGELAGDTGQPRDGGDGERAAD